VYCSDGTRQRGGHRSVPVPSSSIVNHILLNLMLTFTMQKIIFSGNGIAWLCKFAHIASSISFRNDQASAPPYELLKLERAAISTAVHCVVSMPMLLRWCPELYSKNSHYTAGTAFCAPLSVLGRTSIKYASSGSQQGSVYGLLHRAKRRGGHSR
jgi:hypothetical protein